MKRRHSIEADAPPAPDRDADAALSAALQRLAALRQQVHADWSAGIAELLAYTNDDDAHAGAGAFTIAPPARHVIPVRRAPELLPELLLAPPPPVKPAAEIDTSWLALAEAAPLELRGRLPLEEPLPPLELRGRLPADPPVLALATADVLAPPASDDLPSGAGAFVNFFDAAVEEAPPAEIAPTVAEEEITTGYGSAAGVLDWIFPAAAAEPPAAAQAPSPEEEESAAPLAPGAVAGLDALLALAALPETTALLPASAPLPPVEDEPVIAVGAFAVSFDIIAPDAPPPAPVALTEDDVDVSPAYGAHASLFALLDIAPAPVSTPVLVRAFDPQSLVDDAIADAFEALMGPRDPFESVWDADAFVADDAVAPHLSACETALWNLPRRLPCSEIFLANPNHETAVRLTRALRLRANALEARAFADSADFGRLDAALDPSVLWLSTAPECVPFAPVDEDASFPDWQMSAEGLVVVTAPELTPQRPAPPLITEAELDALFKHVDDARAHILDDVGEESEWDEPYWADVDAYLASETQAWRPEDLEHLAAPYDPANDILDIEVRDEPVRVAATHFWMPGDPADMAITGDGDDVFIVGGDSDAAVILVEDGATHAMRTGHAARMDEIIISLSHDAWTHIDAMAWTRLAALSGVASIRVTQAVDHARRVVVAGVFTGRPHADDIRLVHTDEDGLEWDEPVLRLDEPDPLMLADLHAA